MRLRFTDSSRTVVSILISAFVVFVANKANAKEVRFKDYALDIRDGERIAISGIKGAIKLTPSLDGKRAVIKARKILLDKNPGLDQNDLSTKFEALSFNVRREDGVVLVEVKGPETKSAWVQWIKKGSPEMFFELEVPQIPVEINLHEGQVSVLNWKQSLAVSLISGNLKTIQTDGFFRLQMQHGLATIDRHHGPIKMDSFGAKVTVQDLEGDLSIANFSGDTVLSKLKGNIEITANGGATSITKSAGSIDFINGHGVWTVGGFDGPIKGQTDQGAINLTVDGDADVRIESNQGAVVVKLPADSGSMVRMQTEEGTLNPPDAIKPSGNRPKLVNARLPGSGPKGNVTLKSKAGNLRVRI